MRRYVSEETRRKVAHRAGYRCEYCGVYERHSFLAFHIEHILSLKHGGDSSDENLAYACSVCNFNKGTDVATFLPGKQDPVRFFHPRQDNWEAHFEIDPSGELSPKTEVAEATIKIFQLNHPDSIIERKAMLDRGLF